MKSRSKVVKTLEALYPGFGWKAQRDGMGWRYPAKNGWEAHWVSCVNFEPSGAEYYDSRFYIYKGSESPPEQVYGAGSDFHAILNLK